MRPLNGHRQVRLLYVESIKKIRKKGLDLKPGEFAENLTTKGIDLLGLPAGTQLTIGENIKVEVTQSGEECHTGYAIFMNRRFLNASNLSRQAERRRCRQSPVTQRS
ncbi:MAG: hypothetical protein M0024_03470 [Nitrospiraceae bacterium]|nr:hypothetical protein [Nitrospiraceae bacterium]